MEQKDSLGQLKYQNQIKDIGDCPPSECRRMDIKSFRFVFEDISHKNNFLPVLIIKPRRKLRNEAEKCSGYALSFFSSIEKAKKRYINLKNACDNIEKTIGTHIALGLINKTDGLVSKINRVGHFSLHEFKDTDLKKKFHIICNA